MDGTICCGASPAWLELFLSQSRADLEPNITPYPFDHPADTQGLVCLHENDYLRLSKDPRVLAAKASALDVGQLASSLYSGGRSGDLHGRLRNSIASAMRCEDVNLTTNGWVANVGLIEAITQPDMPVYLDQRAHASLWDGARFSKGRAVMIRHNDPEFLERRIQRCGPGVVCIDAWYSVEGTVSDIPAYVDVCERHDCLLVVDEAHSFGMTGGDAGGLAVAQGVAERVPFRTGSFSKAIGGHGGFVAGSAAAMWHLRHFGRPMIFSSAVLPCDVAAHLEALHIAQKEPGLAANALGMAARFRQALESRGIKHSGSYCQIVSVPLPEPHLASVAYARLRDLGVLSSVFVPPGVSVGTSALRFTFHAAMDMASVERAAHAVKQALGDLLPHRLAA